MQLLAYANEKLNKQSTSTTVTAGNSNSNSDSNLQLIIGLIQQQNELLVQLLEKNTDVLLDGKKLNRELQNINKTEQRNTNRALGLI